MNYRGSSRHLVQNALSAMLAAIEIYNKPTFKYRDECFVILLLNAWELILKALISKNGASIYYRKKRGEAYRTYSMTDAFSRAEKYFPASVETAPVRSNLSLLSTYRDNAVHFYNERDFGLLIFSLAQTSILNFRDLLHDSFDIDLTEHMSWRLMPLGVSPPIDPITYMSRSNQNRRKNPAIEQFLAALAQSAKEVSESGADSGRLMTIYDVSLHSTKKIEHADIVAGIHAGDAESAGPMVITKLKDPNVAYPLRSAGVIQSIGTLHGMKFTSHVFQALCFHFGLKDDPLYCWRAQEGVLTKYSNEIIPRIKNVSKIELNTALEAYRRKNKKK